MRLLAELIGIVAGSLAIVAFVARYLNQRRRLKEELRRKELPPADRKE